MPQGNWKLGFTDWWSAGRGWLVRGLSMSAIGAVIGYGWGPLMLAHLQPWAAGLVTGAGAALLWGVLTLVVSFVRTPGKLLKERDAELATAKARIQELETPAFTSEGLSWGTILRSAIDKSERSDSGSIATMPGSFITTVNVTALGDGLPQSLELRLRCSRQPVDAHTIYYRDRTNIDRRTRTLLPASTVRIEDKCVYVEFPEPRLQPPAMLAVTVRGETQQEIAVERVERAQAARAL